MIRFEDVAQPKRETKIPRETKIATARAAVKRGRPRKVEGEPWKAAGVSRATWFRQQKAK